MRMRAHKYASLHTWDIRIRTIIPFRVILPRSINQSGVYSERSDDLIAATYFFYLHRNDGYVIQLQKFIWCEMQVAHQNDADWKETRRQRFWCWKWLLQAFSSSECVHGRGNQAYIVRNHQKRLWWQQPMAGGKSTGSPITDVRVSQSNLAR